ncbi:imelysin family protein [Cytophaga aurantiaca]|uniref:imelysin family protein n=1 Tax=Cytophaga aurantiaca TaxID=29530 RepID=UPI00036A8A81|nr:imelysin family protein [Cytophaga aurantiaca]
MKNISLLMLAGVLLTQVSCKKDDDAAAPDVQAQVVQTYADVVFATYEDSWITAKNLKATAAAFVADPSQAGLEATRAAYLAARTPYIQSEAFRFYAGPIDDDRGLEGLLNSWPLDESYIDYVQGNAGAGIINDATTFPSINTTVIAANNQPEGAGEESVSCGYHAVEFLLWGQDFSVDGPGNRPYTDYIVGTGGTATNQARRAQYLLACIDLLIENLNTLKEEWKAGGGQNYRATFVSTPNASISNFLTGVFRYTDGELSVERMYVALHSEDGDANRQENEQSCFSDQTNNDIILGQKGIRNVYLGKYVRIDGSVVEGKGLTDLVSVADATTNTAVLAAIYDADIKVNAIHAPFDNEIVSTNPAGNIRVQNAIDALHAEAAQYQTAGGKLGMIIN